MSSQEILEMHTPPAEGCTVFFYQTSDGSLCKTDRGCKHIQVMVQGCDISKLSFRKICVESAEVGFCQMIELSLNPEVTSLVKKKGNSQ